jgi:hypothetical protein
MKTKVLLIVTALGLSLLTIPVHAQKASAAVATNSSINRSLNSNVKIVFVGTVGVSAATATVTGLKPGQKVKVTVNVKGK